MKLTGAEIIIRTLIEQGVTDVFGYPGGQVINIYDALYKYRDEINHVLTAHEQGASHAADGYSRATGKVGVCIATSGPGATNLVTGIATAMLDSIPLVAITGNVPCSLIGKDSFQEIDITGITLPITKHNYFVNDVSKLADSIREAFRIARSGRPGPVLVDVPKDVQVATFEFEEQPIPEKFPLPIAEQAQIDEAIAMLNAAKRPYIYIGGGAAGLSLGKEIIALAEKMDAYIGCTFMGLSAVNGDCDRFLGMQGMHGHYASSMAQKDADLILGVGVRFSDRATGNVKKYARGTKVIQLDPDFSEINKNVLVDIGIVADVKDAFTRIAAGVSRQEHAEWREVVEKYRAREAQFDREQREQAGDKLVPRRLFDIINAHKLPATVIATDVGQHQMWTAQYASFDMPRRFVSSGGLGTMGFGLGAAIGAQVATKDPVVLITGDGSFGMNLNELATAVSYQIPLVIVIVNNGVLGMVRQWQTLFFGGRYSNTVLERKTDFVKLAEAFGAVGMTATTPVEFEAAFTKALTVKGPVVIDTYIDKDEFVLPMLPPGGSIEDIITKARAKGEKDNG
ncbi:MAG: biosynthetic-type acetolactate synthase large subunit [Ruminococcaceae bacterium]|nr:biosynthetic-type acetolactate synthase large subunit [Oscillospiraceae bacterium]